MGLAAPGTRSCQIAIETRVPILQGRPFQEEERTRKERAKPAFDTGWGPVLEAAHTGAPCELRIQIILVKMMCARWGSAAGSWTCRSRRKWGGWRRYSPPTNKSSQGWPPQGMGIRMGRQLCGIQLQGGTAGDGAQCSDGPVCAPKPPAGRAPVLSRRPPPHAIHHKSHTHLIQGPILASISNRRIIFPALSASASSARSASVSRGGGASLASPSLASCASLAPLSPRDRSAGQIGPGAAHTRPAR